MGGIGIKVLTAAKVRCEEHSHTLLACHWGGTKHPGQQHLPQSKSCSTEQPEDADVSTQDLIPLTDLEHNV